MVRNGLGRRILSAALAASAFLSFAQGGRTCTTFCIVTDGGIVYGRNYDWHFEDAMFVVNKRGVAKVSVSDVDPARWISRYGSVTVNQYGREFPLGGVNEAGLVLECMWLESTEYPAADGRPSLPEVQWIQYQLDSSETVGDVIESDSRLRIDAALSSPLHFLVSDRSGDSAVIEFIDGSMKVTTGESLRVAALTNDTYRRSAGMLDAVGGEGGEEAVRRTWYSLKRFIWAAEGVRAWDRDGGKGAVDHAWSIIDKVSVRQTMFSLVYDPQNTRIYFKTKSYPEIKYINYGNFEFGCGTDVTVLDMACSGAGDVTGRFVPYDREANYRLIRTAHSKTDFLSGTPEERLRMIAGYPELLPCAGSKEE